MNQFGKLTCAYCDVPIDPNWFRQNQRVQAIKSRHVMCNNHQMRDKLLVAAVLDCLRLLDKKCEILEVIGLFSDVEKAKKVIEDPKSAVQKNHRGAKDPFRNVRHKYNDKEPLSPEDIDRWIEDGIISLNEDGTVSDPNAQLLNELNLRQEVRTLQQQKSPQATRKSGMAQARNSTLAKSRSKG